MPSPASRVSAAAVLLAAALACSRSPRPEPTATTDSFLITRDQIKASGAATAWDALRLTVPILDFRESGRGVPVAITRRGRSSINLDDQPRIWVDNVRIVNIRDLDLLPAVDIESIQVLSGIDATTHYGGSSTTGAVVIRTRTGPS